MQTFLPYQSFRESAKCLDRQRLGKQRVECLQLLKILDGSAVGTGWAHHPALLMWQGYETWLALYQAAMIQEWVSRGYRNTLEYHDFLFTRELEARPFWLGNDAFHASHRANLLRKDPVYYGQFEWADDPTLPYVWPVRMQKGVLCHVSM